MQETLYFATGNANKLLEVLQIVAAYGAHSWLQVLPARDLGALPPLEETAQTFEGNALLKAKSVQHLLSDDAWILAEDSGLCVDALEGAPGIYSARYAGPKATDCQNREKLLAGLKNVSKDKRIGRFVCACILLNRYGKKALFHGIVSGTITEREIGHGGFGYDSLFIPNGGAGKTFAELSIEEKNILSHRGAAIGQMIRYLGLKNGFQYNG